MTEKGSSKNPSSQPILRSDAPRSGKRRIVEPVECVPLRWPTTRPLQREVVETWHDFATQIATNDMPAIRALNVIWKEVYWEDGAITATDSRLSERGGVSATAMNRGVNRLVAYGLLINSNLTKSVGGRPKTRRTLRLSLPRILPKGMDLPDTLRDVLDLRGQAQPSRPLDLRGQAHIDQRGMATSVLCDKKSVPRGNASDIKRSCRVDQSATEAPSRPILAGVGAQFDLFGNGEKS